MHRLDIIGSILKNGYKMPVLFNVKIMNASNRKEFKNNTHIKFFFVFNILLNYRLVEH